MAFMPFLKWAEEMGNIYYCSTSVIAAFDILVDKKFSVKQEMLFFYKITFAAVYNSVIDIQQMTHVTRDVSTCTRTTTTVRWTDVLCSSSPKTVLENTQGKFLQLIPADFAFHWLNEILFQDRLS